MLFLGAMGESFHFLQYNLVKKPASVGFAAAKEPSDRAHASCGQIHGFMCS